MDYVKAFLTGGLICALAQILMEKTKMLPGRIMVLLVVAGAVLGAAGVYEPFLSWAGAGASVGSPVLPNSHGAPPFPWPQGSDREMSVPETPTPSAALWAMFPDPSAQLFLHFIPSGPPAHLWATGL